MPVASGWLSGARELNYLLEIYWISLLQTLWQVPRSSPIHEGPSYCSRTGMASCFRCSYKITHRPSYTTQILIVNRHSATCFGLSNTLRKVLQLQNTWKNSGKEYLLQNTSKLKFLAPFRLINKQNLKPKLPPIKDKIRYVSAFAKLRKPMLASSCLSVRPHGTALLPLSIFRISF